MAIVRYPDPRLTQKAEPREVDDEMREIARRLLEAFVATGAGGLAAAHIGEVAPIVVMLADPEGQGRESLVLYNPAVNAVSPEVAIVKEGSVSLPGLEVEIERPVWADVSWQDEAGRAQARRFDNMAARVVLHEIDQLNGIFFLMRLSRLKREMALKKWKRLAAQSGRAG